ncbi:MAG: DoxX family protein [Planctomycetota bacterium]
MTDGSKPEGSGGPWTLIARAAVGGMFIYLAFKKIGGLPDFHKVMKTYDILPLDPPWILNGTAMYLPFLELVLGVLIIVGLFTRTSFLMVLGMLIFFTIAVYLRGTEIQQAAGLAFSEVKFDCGCGTGEVFLWKKLIENGLLIVASIIGVFSSQRVLSIDGLRSRDNEA